MSFAGVFAILAILDFAVFNDFSFEIRAVKPAGNICAIYLLWRLFAVTFPTVVPAALFIHIFYYVLIEVFTTDIN